MSCGMLSVRIPVGMVRESGSGVVWWSGGDGVGVVGLGMVF